MTERFTDLVDRACETEARMRDDALANQRHAAQKNRLVPCGRCHNCNEGVRGGLLFCDGDCRDDYEKAQRARERNGR